MRQSESTAASAPRCVPWRGVDLVRVFVWREVLGLFGGFLISAWAASAISPQQHDYRAAIEGMASRMLATGALFACVYLLLIRRHALTWANVGLRRTSRRWCWLGVGLGVAMACVTRGVGLALAGLLGGGISLDSLANSVSLDGALWVAAVAELAVFVFAVPVVEEIFFRGFVYTWMRARWGVAGAVIGSALLFGIVHINPVAVAGGVTLGAVCALAYEHSRSLWPAVIVHGVSNVLPILAVLAVGGLLSLAGP